MTDPNAPRSRRELRQVADAAPAPAQRSPFAFVREHPRVWIGIAAGVAFVLLGTGAVVAGAAVGSSRPSAAGSSSAPAGDSTSTARPVPGSIPAAEALRTCSIDAVSRDSRLGTFVGNIVDLGTGTTLFTRKGDKGAEAPGTLALLTGALAMKTLGPDYTLQTRVYQGADPGTIVLVGGGDPTLSALPDGQQSIYPDAPKLAELASQVTTALNGQPVTQIVIDASLWPETDSWSGGWDRKLVGQGYLAPVVPLEVDGGREDATKLVSPRTGNPVSAAGEAFAAALGVTDVPIVDGTVSEGATQLGEVESQPMSSLVTTMLQLGDATLAEQLARIISVGAGGDGTLQSYQNLMPAELSSLELDQAGVTVIDGSGTSPKNSVPPEFMTALVGKLRVGADNLSVVYNALSVAGQSGSLSTRFGSGNRIARGHVTAQAGPGALAGVVEAADGTLLGFSFTASAGESANGALETVTTGAYTCGSNLSDH